jgi:hypothetical protein
MKVPFRKQKKNDVPVAAAVVEKPPPPPIILKPQPQEIAVRASAEYFTLATDIGLETPVILEEKLRVCLKKLKIFVYNYERVMEYLKTKLPSSRQFIYWSPLRHKDYNMMGGNIYTHPVPGQALQKVKQILKTFEHPEQLIFTVSSYETKNPDPFLAVQVKNGNRQVIAFWDEPGFTLED